MHIAQRDVRGHEHHAQPVGREHHRDVRARERREHLRVSRKVVAAREQRVLVDGRGDDPLHVAGERERRRALDRESGEPPGRARRCRQRATRRPLRSTGTTVPDGPDDHQLARARARAHRRVRPATISGPMPRGSPSVTARRGLRHSVTSSLQHAIERSSRPRGSRSCRCRATSSISSDRCA